MHVAAEDEITKDNFALLPSVSAEEHKAIAQAYVSRIEESERPKFEAALAESDYWPHWSRLINAGPQKTDWSAFRFEKLCELFRTKAIGAGLSAPTAEVALNNLLIGKKEKQMPRDNQAAGDLGAGATRDMWRATRGDLHRAIHVMIDRMSENELRRLWLPLGDVLDALRIPRR